MESVSQYKAVHISRRGPPVSCLTNLWPPPHVGFMFLYNHFATLYVVRPPYWKLWIIL